MSSFVTTVHIITCVLLVLVVLLQSGKGADISATLGGSSQTVFGSSGGANFFTRFTSTLAAVFFTTSILLTVLGGQARKSVFEGAPAVPATSSAPTESVPAAVPAAPAQAPAEPAKK
jgi:preprotein translocase subunit SecG